MHYANVLSNLECCPYLLPLPAAPTCCPYLLPVFLLRRALDRLRERHGVTRWA